MADSSSESDGEYRVEAILQKRKQRGKFQFLIKWEGYGSEDNTWEPIEHLDGAAKLLAIFNEHNSEAGVKRAQETPKGKAASSAAARPSVGRPAAVARPAEAAQLAGSAKREPPVPGSDTGGVVLPAGWKYKRIKPGGSGTQWMWVWMGPKGHVFRSVQTARSAIAREAARRPEGASVPRARPKVAGSSAPNVGLAGSGSRSSGKEGGGAAEGLDEGDCTFCGGRLVFSPGQPNSAALETVNEGAPVCRRCAAVVFEGLGATGDGVMQLDSVIAMLGMQPIHAQVSLGAVMGPAMRASSSAMAVVAVAAVSVLLVTA